MGNSIGSVNVKVKRASGPGSPAHASADCGPLATASDGSHDGAQGCATANDLGILLVRARCDQGQRLG